MKLYTVTQFYNGYRDYQHIRAESKEKAIEIARDELEEDDAVNECFNEDWFAEEEEEE